MKDLYWYLNFFCSYQTEILWGSYGDNLLEGYKKIKEVETSISENLRLLVIPYKNTFQ